MILFDRVSIKQDGNNIMAETIVLSYDFFLQKKSLQVLEMAPNKANTAQNDCAIKAIVFSATHS